MILISCLLLSYLAGSIPFGLIFSYYAGFGDVREIGSGNIGATNVLRTGNKKLAMATLLCDALKGFIPVLLIFYSYPSVAYGAGMAVVIGHVFPCWLKFKGGKGVATALGVYFAVQPLLALLSVLVWIGVAKVWRISSLSALVALGVCPLIAVGMYLGGKAPVELCYLTFAIALLILYTHRENFQRLVTGQEGNFRKQNH